MNSKFMPAKYLAIFLLALVALLFVSYDAFSQSEIDLGTQPESTVMTTSQSIMAEEITWEPYETTCTREVQTGTSYRCSGGMTETRCRKVPGVGDECWEETSGETCSYEPDYSTETYSCTEQRKVVNYVYDYSVHAKIEVTRAPALPDLVGCKFGVNLEATSENFYAKCTNAIVRVKVISRTETMRGRDKERAIKVELTLSSIEELNALVHGVEDFKFEKGMATFIAADLSTAKNFSLNMGLTRNRFLLKDKVVFNKVLKNEEFKVLKLENGKAVISVDINKLAGGFDTTKKHTLKLALKTNKAVDVKDAINTPKLENSLTRSVIIND